MNEVPINELFEWLNAASEEEIRAWIHERLHGQDRRWPDNDDGLSVPGHLIGVVARHRQTTAFTQAVIVKAVHEFLQDALTAWSKLPASVPDNTVAADWNGLALVELLYLAPMVIGDDGRRSQIRHHLIRAAPRLPLWVGSIPLRAKALAILNDFGGHADKSFWKSCVSDDYTAALPIAFLGMAKQDLTEALIWLGKRTMKEQADTVRKLRPTLVKLAGGEFQFMVLGRRYLFQSTHVVAEELRQELLPLENNVLFLPSDRIAQVNDALLCGGEIVPMILDDSNSRVTLVAYAELQKLNKVAEAIGRRLASEAFHMPIESEMVEMSYPNYVRTITRRRPTRETRNTATCSFENNWERAYA
jgi:hypothetical protein